MEYHRLEGYLFTFGGLQHIYFGGGGGGSDILIWRWRE